MNTKGDSMITRQLILNINGGPCSDGLAWFERRYGAQYPDGAPLSVWTAQEQLDALKDGGGPFLAWAVWNKLIPWWCMSRADLSGANLGGANLRDADISRADLRGVNLRDANLRDANLGDANLRGADISRANLCDADLSGADLSGANLGGANLRGADISRANLCDADLSGADLSGAKVSTDAKWFPSGWQIGPSGCCDSCDRNWGRLRRIVAVDPNVEVAE